MESRSIIEDYISIIKENPSEYEKDYKIVKEEVKNSTAYQYGKPAVFSYQPILFSQKDVDNFEYINETILSIGTKVLDKYIENPEYRKKFGFPEFIEKMILVDPGYDVEFPMVRVDAYYNNREDFGLIEINTDGASGMNADNELAKILLDSKGLEELKQDYYLKSFELFDSWVEASLDLYSQYNPDNKLPNVAIVDLMESATGPDFDDFKKAYERAGLNCEIVDVRDLEYRDGKLYHEDYKIDLIYRRLVTFELINHHQDCQDFIDAYIDGAMCTVGSIRTQIIHNKMFFKILFDEDTREFLTESEIDFIDKHIPHTGLLGEKEEDIEKVISNKDEYIIKPLDDNQSTGVYAGRDLTDAQWKENIKRDTNEGKIFQQFIPLKKDPYVNLEDELWIEELSNMMGIFSYNHKFAGTYNRMGRINVIKDPGEYLVAPGILAIKRSMEDILPRINELAAIAKKRELTEEEASERHDLRQEYLNRFRAGMKEQLLSVKVVDEEGQDITPAKLKKAQRRND